MARFHAANSSSNAFASLAELQRGVPVATRVPPDLNNELERQGC
jgi:hypothetical protein